MTHLTRCQAMLLAALLDADGRVVSYAALGEAVGAWSVNEVYVVRQHVNRLRRKGVACIETVPRRGCRLTAVPPDWTLETVLAMVDVLRRDGYGAVALRRIA